MGAWPLQMRLGRLPGGVYVCACVFEGNLCWLPSVVAGHQPGCGCGCGCEGKPLWPAILLMTSDQCRALYKQVWQALQQLRKCAIPHPDAGMSEAARSGHCTQEVCCTLAQMGA
eukprot:1140794-Pelagomonas_calceolata.AAC.2